MSHHKGRYAVCLKMRILDHEETMIQITQAESEEAALLRVLEDYVGDEEPRWEFTPSDDHDYSIAGVVDAYFNSTDRENLGFWAGDCLYEVLDVYPVPLNYGSVERSKISVVLKNIYDQVIELETSDQEVDYNLILEDIARQLDVVVDWHLGKEQA